MNCHLFNSGLIGDENPNHSKNMKHQDTPVKPYNRRRFLKDSALVAGVASISPQVLGSTSSASPSNRIQVALIGCRNMGFGLLKHALSFADVNCAALCDVDQKLLEERAAEIESNFGQKPKHYSDFRRLLENPDIDAVFIGTPDHWHCLMMVYALQAGKDVYVEKPLGNSIAECDIMVRAAKRYHKQLVQVGQQQRSGEIFQQAMQIVQKGDIGNLRKIQIWANFDYGVGPEIVPDSPVPDGVDYDMWLGPAPQRPFNKNRFHGKWRHFWDYGSGMASDWGVHLMDIALWTDHDLKGPKQALVYADNTFSKPRARETFDSMSITYPKKDWSIHFEVTAGLQRGPWDMLYGMAFAGEDGTLVLDRKKLELFPEWDNDSESYRTYSLKRESGSESHREHVRNFLDCIKSRKTPTCTPEMGRASALHMHIANIAGRVSEPVLEWDDAEGRFKNSDAANALITPVYRAPWTLPQV